MSIDESMNWKNQGDNFVKQGKYEEAIRCYNDAITLNPENIAAWNNMGYSLSKLGRNDEAKKIKLKINELKEKEKIQKENQTFEFGLADKSSNIHESSPDLTQQPVEQVSQIKKEMPKIPEVKEMENNLSDQNLMRDTLKKKFGKEPSDNDIQWGLLNKEKLETMQSGNWKKYCDIDNKMGDVLRKEGKFESALEHYFVDLYLCINGPGDKQSNNQFFDPKDGFVNSEVIQKVSQLKNIMGYSDDQIKIKFLAAIDRNWKIPLKVPPETAWGLLNRANSGGKNTIKDDSPPHNQKYDQYSKAHLLLLSKFLYPREREHFVKSDGWTEVLKEPSENALETFLRNSLLRKASLEEKMSAKFTIPQLKPLLKERNLPVTGKKDVLIDRLIQNDQKGMDLLVANVDILICTNEGKTIAEDYLAKERNIRSEAEQKVFSNLLNGKYYEASRIVANFEAEQVFSRGVGIDWQKYDSKRDERLLNLIFTKTPKILHKYSRDQIDALRPAAAMMHLWGTNDLKKWLPSDFPASLQFEPDTAARMILFHARFLSNIEEYKKSGIKSVEIMTAPDSCENCKKEANKVFNINSVPELPSPECTFKYGCRCIIVPKIF